jgi:hypothetical protein
MIRKLTLLLAGIVWPVLAGAAIAQVPPAELHVKLSLADNKATYRIGEPIKLVLEFTADQDGYQVDTISDQSQQTSDFISVSPDSGVNHWLENLGGRYPRDVISLAKLSTTPTRLELLLNYSIRFDSAGQYSIKVTTHRVTPISTSRDYPPAVPLTTNEVSIRVEAMSDADEEKEVKRLSDLLDAARGWQAEERVTEELSFLTGDISSREKVRRFLNAEGRSGNYFGHISSGLYIARNRALVLQLLEAAMRDPNTPVGSALLSMVTRLRVLRETSGARPQPAVNVVNLSPYGDPRTIEIQDAYVTELAAGLPKRTGKSQSTTATTVLTHLPKDPQVSAALLNEVRRILLLQFASLHPFDQEYLLNYYWEQLRDPALLPILRQMLKSHGSVGDKNIHDTALKRLLEVAPDEAREYVLAEIRDPKSLVDFQILRSLSDSTLVEADAPLLQQIRSLASSKVGFDQIYLKHKASLAARFATESIYPDLMEIYRTQLTQLPVEVRAAFLAYFARYHEPEALPLIEETLADLQQGQESNFLPDLTRLYYSDSIGSLLRERLESANPLAAGLAAYLISLHGSAADQKVIEARLERWRKEWSDRSVEADSNLQGTVERELITALTRAKSWKLPPERVKELQQSCITQICRQHFHSQ